MFSSRRSKPTTLEVDLLFFDLLEFDPEEEDSPPDNCENPPSRAALPSPTSTHALLTAIERAEFDPINSTGVTKTLHVPASFIPNIPQHINVHITVKHTPTPESSLTSTSDPWTDAGLPTWSPSSSSSDSEEAWRDWPFCASTSSLGSDGSESTDQLRKASLIEWLESTAHEQKTSQILESLIFDSRSPEPPSPEAFTWTYACVYSRKPR